MSGCLKRIELPRWRRARTIAITVVRRRKTTQHRLSRRVLEVQKTTHLAFQSLNATIPVILETSQAQLVVRRRTIPESIQPAALSRLRLLKIMDSIPECVHILTQLTEKTVVRRCMIVDAIEALLELDLKTIKSLDQGADLVQHGRLFMCLIEAEPRTFTSRRSWALDVAAVPSSFK
jgi:hypothetical protein